MPFIKIYGTSPSWEHFRMVGPIQQAAFSVKELGLKNPGDTAVVFPKDQNNLPRTDVLEVVITLFSKPGRTLEVRNRLAQAVGEAIQQMTWISKPKIFCYINLVDRDAVGAWKSE